MRRSLSRAAIACSTLSLCNDRRPLQRDRSRLSQLNGISRTPNCARPFTRRAIDTASRHARRTDETARRLRQVKRPKASAPARRAQQRQRPRRRRPPRHSGPYRSTSGPAAGGRRATSGPYRSTTRSTGCRDSAAKPPAPAAAPAVASSNHPTGAIPVEAAKLESDEDAEQIAKVGRPAARAEPVSAAQRKP